MTDALSPSPSPRRRSPLTRRGWGVLAASPLLVLAGWWLGYEELVITGFAAAGAVVGSSAWLLVRPKVEIERELYPDRVAAGEVAFGRVKVRNLSSRPSSSFVAREQFGDDLLDVAVPKLPPRERVSQAYRLPTSRRGVVPVGPMRIGRADPLGLVNSEQRHGDVLTLWVHPRHVAVSAQPSQLTRSLEGPSSDTSPQGSITFHAVREYVRGDDLRKVHWRSTARTGNLMVRQYVDTSLPDVTIVADTSGSGGEDLLERRLEVVASLLLASTTRHFPVRVFGTGGLDVSSKGGGHASQELLDVLAAVQPDGGRVAEVLNRLSRGHGGAGLVVVASSPDAAAIDALGSMPRRFGRVTLVDVRGSVDGAAVPVAVRGVGVVTCTDLASFATGWRRRIAR